MTKTELNTIEARASAASEGPWGICFDGGMLQRVTRTQAPDVASVPSFKDAIFITHARTDIPALIAEVRRLQDRLRQTIKILER